MAPTTFARPGPDVLLVTIGWPLPSVILPERPPTGVTEVGLVLDYKVDIPGQWNGPVGRIQGQTGHLFLRGTTYQDPPLPPIDFVEIQSPEPRTILGTVNCGCIVHANITDVKPGQGQFEWFLSDVLQVPSYLVAIPRNTNEQSPRYGDKLFVWSV